MIFGNKDNKKKENKKHWLLYLITGAVFFGLFKKRSDIKERVADIEHNFLDFLHKEKKEVVELENHQENLQRFYKDSYDNFLDYFIPCEINDHKPRILHSNSLVIIALSVLFLKLALVGYLFFAHPNDGKMSEDIIKAVITKVNEDRLAAGLSELKVDSDLTLAAQAKARDMSEKDYFAHYSPDGEKPWDFIDRTKYKYLYVAENLAIDFTNAESVHKALMNSPSHKKNILSSKYEDLGIAMLSDDFEGRKTNILVEFFAIKEKTVSPEKLIQNTENINPDNKVVENKEVAKLVSEEKPVIKEDNEKELLKGEDSQKNTSVLAVEVETENNNESSNSAPKISREVTPSSSFLLSLREDMELISPNPEIEDGVVNDISGYKNDFDKKASVDSAVSKSVNIVMLGVLLLLSAFLFLNIVIRFEVQHKPVIVQTLLLMLFVSSLIFLKVHSLENGLSDILIL